MQSFDSFWVELSSSGAGSFVLQIKHITFFTKNWVIENILGKGGGEGNNNNGKGHS